MCIIKNTRRFLNTRALIQNNVKEKKKSPLQKTFVQYIGKWGQVLTHNVNVERASEWASEKELQVSYMTLTWLLHLMAQISNVLQCV